VRVAAVVPLFLASFSCLQLGAPETNDAGAPPPGSSRSADAQDVAPQGSDCAVDSISGVTLCTRIALCPGVSVDHDAYPNCGFRASAGSIEVDCVCGDFLCPIGISIDCAQAARLLAAQSEAIACTQVSEERCAPRNKAPPAGNPSCDKNCAAGCAADPGCLRLCGC
jgi:hypothetical protein